MRSANRERNSSINRSCFGREQRFILDGARPVDVSVRAEFAYGWHALCCHLVKRNWEAERKECKAERSVRLKRTAYQVYAPPATEQLTSFCDTETRRVLRPSSSIRG
jgi:hypothetical protein